jgi:hypothetical protein
MTVDFKALDMECKLIARYITRGDGSVAQPKINKLVTDYPELAGNIRLTITNYLVDMITNPAEPNGQEADGV